MQTEAHSSFLQKVQMGLEGPVITVMKIPGWGRADCSGPAGCPPPFPSVNGTAFVGSPFPRWVVVETAGHRALSSRGQGVPRAPPLHFELKLRGGAQLPTGSLQG